MKKKTEKLPKLSPEHLEGLAKIGSLREFKALESLCGIEEKNIIIQSFKVNSSDPDIARKKAWHEGRAYQLRKLMKTFETAIKKANN